MSNRKTVMGKFFFFFCVCGWVDLRRNMPTKDPVRVVPRWIHSFPASANSNYQPEEDRLKVGSRSLSHLPPALSLNFVSGAETSTAPAVDWWSTTRSRSRFPAGGAGVRAAAPVVGKAGTGRKGKGVFY